MVMSDIPVGYVTSKKTKKSMLKIYSTSLPIKTFYKVDS
jgi:hypothetical protein